MIAKGIVIVFIKEVLLTMVHGVSGTTASNDLRPFPAVQEKMNAYCDSVATSHVSASNCPSSKYIAIYDKSYNSQAKSWKCFHESTLNAAKTAYNSGTCVTNTNNDINTNLINLLGEETDGAYNQAKHFFNLQYKNYIIDHVTKNGPIQHDFDLPYVVSPTGSALRFEDFQTTLSLISSPVPTCTLAPSAETCNDNGISMTMYVKPRAPRQVFLEAFSDNSNAGYKISIDAHKRLVVEMRGARRRSSITSDSRSPLHLHFWNNVGFKWRETDRAQVVFAVVVNGYAFSSYGLYSVSPLDLPRSRSRLVIGDRSASLATNADLDNIAFWETLLSTYSLKVPLRSILDNHYAAVLTIEFVLRDYLWSSHSGAIAQSSLANDITNQVRSIYQAYGYLKTSSVSNFREVDNAVGASLRLDFYRTKSSLWLLQVAFEAGTFVGSKVDIIGCQAPFVVLCQIPVLDMTWSRADPNIVRGIRMKHIRVVGDYGNLWPYYQVQARSVNDSSFNRIIPSMVYAVYGNPPLQVIDVTYLPAYTWLDIRLWPVTWKYGGLSSLPVRIRTAQGRPVRAPTIAQAYKTTNTSLYIKWLQNIPQIDWQGVPTGYTITWENCSQGRSFIDVGLVDSFEITNLTPFKKYEVRVAGRTVAGAGIYASVTVWTDISAPTATPREVQLTTPDCTTLKLTFLEIEECFKGGEIQGYNVILKDAETSTRYNYTVPLSETLKLNMVNLKCYHPYTVGVYGYSAVGKGPENWTSLMYTAQSVPTQPPRNVTIDNQTFSSIGLSWQPIPEDYVFGILISYTIFVTDLISTTPRQITVQPNLTFHNITSLHSYYPYKISIRGSTSKGNGPKSQEIETRTGENVPRNPPSFTVTAVTSRHVLLSWTFDFSLSNVRGVPRGFNISVTSPSNVTRSIALPTNVTSINVTRLEPYTVYRVKVSAYTIGETGSSKVIRTAEEAPESAPTLHLMRHSRYIVASWTFNFNLSNVRGNLSAFNLYVTYPGGQTRTNALPITVTSRNITDLEPYRVYVISIAAETVAETRSRNESVTTLEEVPLRPPTIRFTVQSRMILLSWTFDSSLSNVRGKLRAFNVSLTTPSNATMTSAVSPNVTSTNMTGLQPYTVYRVEVSAYTISGTSSTEIIRTAEEAPATSPMLDFTPHSRYINISWTFNFSLPNVRGNLSAFNLYVTYPGGQTSKSVLPTSVTSHNVMYLKPYRVYVISIGAETVAETRSSNESVTTLEEAPAEGPTFNVFSLSTSNINVTWQHINETKRNGVITGYTIRVYLSGHLKITSRTSGNTTSAIVDSLSMHTTYTVQVSGNTSAGEGPSAGSATVTTDDDECLSGRHNCDENAECFNLPGSFTCQCLPGYTGTGTSCVDVDECVTISPCLDTPSCVNTIGSYRCKVLEKQPDGVPLCNLPPFVIRYISKDGKRPTFLRKKERLIFTTNLTTDCKELSTSWKLYPFDPVKRKVLFNKSTIVSTLSEWPFPNSLSVSGHFLVKFVAESASENVLMTDYGYLEVAASSRLIIKVLGGWESTVGVKDVIRRRATVFDPDDRKHPIKQARFQWYCKTTEENYAHDILSYNEMVQLPSQPINESRGGCFGTGAGKLNITSSEFYFPGIVLVPDKTYELTVVASNGSRNGSFMQRVTLTNGSVCVISIRCEFNCDERVILGPQLRLTTRCTNEIKNVVYEWTLKRQINGSEWKEVEDFASFLLTKAKSKNFALKTSFLNASTKYKAVVKSSTLDSEGATGISDLEFETVTLPQPGECSISPTSGIAFTTRFRISCINWISTRVPLQYIFIATYADGIHSLLSYGYASEVETALSPGDPVNITVHIITLSGATATVRLAVNVNDSIQGILNSSYILDMMYGTSSLYNQILLSFKHQKAARLSNAILGSIMSLNAIDDKTKEKVIESVVGSMHKFHGESVHLLSQRSSTLAFCLIEPRFIKNDNQISQELREMLKILGSINSQQDVQDGLMIEFVKQNLAYITGKLMIINRSNTNNSDGTQVLQSLDYMLTITAQNVVSGQDSVFIKITGGIVAVVIKYEQDMDEDTNQTLSVGNSSVSFFVNEILKRMNDSSGFLVCKVVNLQTNPFGTSSGGDSVKSQVVILDIENQHGKKTRINNLERDIELVLSITDSGKPGCSNKGYSHFAKPNQPSYHMINIENEGISVIVSLCLQFEGEILEVYVTHSQDPSGNTYDKMFTLPDLTVCEGNTWDTRGKCASNPYDFFLTPGRGPGLYRVAVTRLNATEDDGEKNGNNRREKRDIMQGENGCFSGRRNKRSCIGVKPRPPPPAAGLNVSFVPTYDPLTDMNYTLTTTQLRCLYYSEDLRRWKSKGCRAGRKSTNTTVQCLCNHATAFGANMFVAPNPIDFDKVFVAFLNLGDSGNVAVMVTVIVMFGVYLVAVVFARRADKKDIPKVGPPISVQITKEKSALHEYTFTVYTGAGQGSGTTANVSMVMYGKSRNSEPIKIHRDMIQGRVLLSRGSVDHFIVSLPENLGELFYLQVEHDNTGLSPSWFLDYVTVKHLGEEYTFNCKRWLDTYKEDCRTSRLIPVQATQVLTFRDTFSENVSSSLQEKHLWVSTFTKRPINPFTRVQRCTCVLCIVMVSMLANAMFYNLTGVVHETVRVGPFKLSWYQIMVSLQSCLVVLPVSIVIVWIFSNTRQSVRGHKSEKYLTEVPAHSPGLPHFCNYIGWAISIGASLVSATFTIMYSLLWGKEKAEEWLASITVSIFADMLALQPIKIVVISFVSAFLVSKAKSLNPNEFSFSQNLKNNNANREKDKNESCLATLKADDLEQLRWFQEHGRLRAMMFVKLRELILFILFLLMVMIVCYGGKDYDRYTMTTATTQAFDIKFESIREKSLLWPWLETFFLPGIFAGKWYNDHVEPQEVYIGNKVSVLLGMPRLRQLRVQKGPCLIGNLMSITWNMDICYDIYSSTNEDRTPISLYGWKPVPLNLTLSRHSAWCPKPWRYRTASELGNDELYGRTQSYDGGGYVTDLGYNAPEAKKAILEVAFNNWLDYQTRVVVLEFAIYNTNKNLVSISSYIVEVPPVGGTFLIRRTKTLSLYSTASGMYDFMMFCHLVLMIFVVGYLIANAVALYKQRCGYFNNFWHLVDLLLILVCILSVAFHYIREKSAKAAIKSIKENPYEPASFHDTLFWSSMEDLVLSFVVFLCTVKLLKIISFGESIIRLSWSLRAIAKYMTSFGFVFAIVFLAYAQFGNLILGTTHEGYSTIPKSCVTLLEMLLGKAAGIRQIEDANRALGSFFAFTYMFSMTVFLINMFVVILNFSFEDVKEFQSEIEDAAELSFFMAAQIMKGFSELVGNRSSKQPKPLFCTPLCIKSQYKELSEKVGSMEKKLSFIDKVFFAEDDITIMYLEDNGVRFNRETKRLLLSLYN